MTAETASLPSFLTVEQVAKRFNVSTDSIWRWKRAGTFSLPVRVGSGCTRWRLADIEAYESQLQTCFMMDASFILDSPFVKALKAKDDDSRS